MGVIENRVRTKIDEFLRESFSKEGTLLKQLRGEILELEYKLGEDMIQDILDSLDSKVTALQVELSQKEARILFLETENISLKERLVALEPKEEEPPV